jgi:hypothetical protein
VTRSRKGRTSFVVTHRGAAQIVGSWIGTPDMDEDEDNGAESYPVYAEVLERLGLLKSGRIGRKAQDVLAITQALYGDQIPPLMGTDVMQWASLTPARTGVRHDVNDDGTPDYGDWASADECYTARHRSHLLTELPHGASLAGVKASDLEDEREHAGALKAWPTRYKLRRVHGRRIGDPTDRTETLSNGYCWTERDHLTAPGADSERVWIGHKLVTRPAPKNGASTNGRRARVARVKRTIDEIHATTLPELLARFASVPVGKRAKWTCQGKSGTFTRAADSRMTVGTPQGALVKSVRTVDAVERKLTAYLAA